MLVYKFGGTSVGNAARFEAVADIIRSAEDPELLVVVSAMSGTTNALIAGARAAEEGDEQQSRLIKEQLLTKHLQAVEHLFAGSPERSHLAAYMTKCMEDYDRLCLSIATLGELTRRGIDAVASLGEQMSNRILAALLRQRGTPAQAIDATTCIRTDSEFGAATPDMDATRRLVTGQILPLLSKGIVPVVTGFIASNPRGVTTTLGRGGSDYSAAILGVSLDADEVWIWTDVNGILTADPKLVREARTLELLSYAEAEELAYFGASVLHPKTVTPLAERGIALRIMNSFEPTHPGTLIVSEPDPDRLRLPAIISTEGLSLIGVSGNGGAWSLHLASRALRSLAEGGIEVLMLSQSFSERSLNLVVHKANQDHGIHVLQKEFENEMALNIVSRIGVQEQVATLSVVGMPRPDGETIVPRAYSALGQLGTRVVSVAQAASAYSVSFVVPERDIARAVPFLHRQLGL